MSAFRPPMANPPAVRVGALPAEYAPPPEPELGARVDNLWRMVWRHRWPCLGLFLLVAMAGGAFLASQAPRYTAHAIMVVASTQPDLAVTDHVARVERGTSLHASDVQNEIELLTSSRAMLKVVQDFRLDDDKEFRSAPRGSFAATLHRQWNAIVGGDWEAALADVPWPWRTGRREAAPPPTEDGLIEAVRKQLKIEPINNSTTIDISFTAQSPQLAADIANAVAKNYIDNRYDVRRQEARRAANYLQERLAELRQQLETAEKALEDFRVRNVLKDGRDLEHVRAEMEKANAQLAAARIARIVAVSKLEAVEAGVRERGIVAALEPGEGGVVTLDDRLREMSAQARAKVASMADYGNIHPESVRAKKEAGLLQSEVTEQANVRLSKLKAHVAIADQQMRLLETALLKSRADFDRLSAALTTQKGLERQVDVSRGVYEAFLNRVKVTEQVGYNEAQSWLISPATAPVSPSSPKALVVLGATFAVATGLALTFALLTEYRTSHTVLSSRSFADTGLRALAMIPRFGRRVDSLQRVLSISGPQSNSVFSESIESLYASVSELPREPGERSLVLLFTSTLPFEGKSTTLIALAARMASAGNRVLVVDGDLRAPQLHRAFGITTVRGVSDLIGEGCQPEEVVRSDPKTGISIVTAGRPHPQPQNLLRSEQLADALRQWREIYDFVLIDSPPVLPISDARALVPLSDYCVFVVHWRKTRWASAVHALQLLRDCGARLAGIVVSKVDVKRLSAYGFVEGEQYGHAYRRYAQPREDA